MSAKSYWFTIAIVDVDYMIPYREEKIKNAAIFFVGEHRKKAKKPLYQTQLYKYLAFFDFYSLRETGRSALDLSYRAMERGPVPLEVYDGRESVTSCRFIKDQSGEIVVASTKPILDYFSDYEIELMERLIDIYAQKWVSANTMSDATHQDIRAWKRTPLNKMIVKSLEFDGDIFKKREDELTFPETVFLTQEALSFEP